MAESVKIEPGKIFVGGLSWDTNKEGLVKYFEDFGEVSDGVIMVDSVTKMPRGFGFITFKDPISVQLVINHNKPHSLDGKKIDPKEAITKDQHATSQMNKNSSIDKKVFVGGLPHGCTSEEINHFFSKYGHVSDVDVKVDKGTNKPRGFAFVEYESNVAAHQAIKQTFQMFKDKKVEVKAAENRIPGGSQASQPSQYSGSHYPSAYGQAANNPNAATYGYGQSFYPYPSYPAYQASQTGYAPTHATPQQPSYPSPSPSFPSNGYQQPYTNQMYSSQSISSTGYPGYPTPTAYPQGYTGTYSTPNDTTPGQPYAQSQTLGNYYQTNYSQGPYQSDNRYSQAPNSQRNW